MKQTSNSDFSQLPGELRVPVNACESGFQELFQRAPLLSLHARFAFETLGKIGEGGMGSVYQVRDLRFDRVAALKLLKDKSATEHARLRFLREAQITAKLDHPAIPPVYEIGLTAGGDLYMLMRLIQGKTLNQCVKECHDLGTLERRELVETVIKVAEAVAYAHSKGIIHRDLKPDNIMVGEFGEVLVIDWGIAKDLRGKDEIAVDKVLERVISKSELEQVGVTVTGTMVGTPGYMAPEQIDGVEIDERADVFALGTILVEILTGERAISGRSNIELVTKTFLGEVKRPRDFDGSLSKEIDWIAKQALELECEGRTQRAEDLVVQLRAYLNGEEIPGYSYSLLERVQRTIKRRPGLIVATTVGALLLALIGNLWLTLELEGQKRKEAEANIVVAEDEAETAKAVLSLFNEARNLVGRGAPKIKLQAKINEALERGGRTENQLLTAARIYSDANFDDENKELLEEAVRLYPPCYEGLFSLHLWELKSSSRELYFTSYLARLLRESKKRGQVNEFTLFGDAYELSLAGRLDEAIETYSRIEEYSTSFSWMYSNRGTLWKKKGKFDKALADYNKAIQINRKYAAAYINRGVIFYEKGELDRALTDYDRAVKLNPGNGVAYSNRGVVFYEKGELDKALADYNRSIVINPGYAVAFTHRGTLWKKKGKFDKAFADYNKAININSRSVSAFINRGLIWEKKCEFDKALADYNRAIEIDPREPIAFLYRGVIWEKKGAFEKALVDYSRAIEINPRYASAFVYRGFIRGKKGQNSKALADMTRAIELKHQNPVVYFYRGSLYIFMKRAKEACGDFETFLRLAPNHPKAGEARANLARVRAARVK